MRILSAAAAATLALTLAAPSGPASAAQDAVPPAASPDAPDLAALKRRIDEGRAAEAERVLATANARTPDNADILNLLGYASRRLARHDAARRFYARALAIDPDHRGALEYMGELELETGDIAAARALLARLRGICPSGCRELDDLLEAFEARGLQQHGGDS